MPHVDIHADFERKGLGAGVKKQIQQDLVKFMGGGSVFSRTGYTARLLILALRKAGKAFMVEELPGVGVYVHPPSKRGLEFMEFAKNVPTALNEFHEYLVKFHEHVSKHRKGKGKGKGKKRV